MTVTPEGCIVQFNEPTHLEENTFTGTADLVCPENKKILVHIYTGGPPHPVKLCTIEIGPQAGWKHIIYHNKTNVGAPDDVTATVTVAPNAEGKEGIKYTTNGAGCPENGKTSENGSYVSNVTLTSGETNTGGETIPLTDDVWLSTS